MIVSLFRDRFIIRNLKLLKHLKMFYFNNNKKKERANEIETYTQNISKEQIELSKIEAKRFLEVKTKI